MSQGDTSNQYQGCDPGRGDEACAGRSVGHASGSTAGLSAVSSEALDALVAAGGRADGVPDALRERAQRALRLLGALELDACLVQEIERGRGRTIAGLLEVVRAAGPASDRAADGFTADRGLSSRDAEAIDALVGAGWDAGAVAPEHRARADMAGRLCGLLEAGGEGLGAELESRRSGVIAGLLSAVSSDIDAERDRLRLDPAHAGAGGVGGRRAWTLGDVASLAAVLVIGTAVALPVLSAIRQEGRRLACASNLGAVAAAIGAYQGDNRQSLPMASLSLAGMSWWDVGTDAEHSNSANLYTVVRQRYAELAQVACSSAPAPTLGPEVARSRFDWDSLENVSYSYQNLFGRPGGGLAWRDCLKPSVVVSDRSPVIVRARAGQAWIDPMENSPNHGGLGQWVVLQDGSAEWMNTPIKSCGDNIWLPEDLERQANEQGQMRRGGRVRSLRGVETPLTREDAFMTP